MLCFGVGGVGVGYDVVEEGLVFFGVVFFDVYVVYFLVDGGLELYDRIGVV